MVNTSTNASTGRWTTPSISPQQIIQQILYSGRITTTERQWLLQAGISELRFSETELAQLRLIHDRLRMGLIKVIDI
ncbi:hypothetical protein [Leptolyngbya sp. FACHB-711]|uniref:hypothetical protein n=1 Tax=unclassified Leptolyngbya TaxID=2650499 RepID=UPI0016883A5A|nr:hypothetical protein [Leptolyngbya sp. FACHB-711]MBD1853602.1 hypothetical protein [Cyanobacteria bacterium FACHB-502]MBD2027873.1 hypothetical protein [Leptolyngbya sp. FACHB-711]